MDHVIDKEERWETALVAQGRYSDLSSYNSSREGSQEGNGDGAGEGGDGEREKGSLEP